MTEYFRDRDSGRVVDESGNDPALKPGLELIERIKAAKHPSGIAPVEFKVLIEPKEQAEKIGSIIVPEEAKEKGKWAEIEGRIVAVSPLAFTYSTDEEWGGSKPKPGDRIIIAKYSGVRVKGADGKEYLLTNDKDVCAVRKD